MGHEDRGSWDWEGIPGPQIDPKLRILGNVIFAARDAQALADKTDRLAAGWDSEDDSNQGDFDE
jgi:hypothetical protein